jgi:hypothetical protein
VQRLAAADGVEAELVAFEDVDTTDSSIVIG